jgi:hypothetical protein
MYASVAGSLREPAIPPRPDTVPRARTSFDGRANRKAIAPAVIVGVDQTQFDTPGPGL